MDQLIFLGFIALALFLIFYGKISTSFRKRKNLKGIKRALNGTEASKSLYLGYMGVLSSGGSPHIKITTSGDTINIPDELKSEENAAFNISPLSVAKLNYNNDKLEFFGKFNGETKKLSIPILNIILVYSPESGIGFEIHKKINQ